MAGIFKAILKQGDQQEHNPLTMSDAQILEQIIATHVHTDSKFDVDSLFNLVQNILKRSTHIIDNVFQGGLASSEHIDDKISQASFNSPLCTLKQISSEMSCKPPGEENAHRTTLAVLQKLSKYSWNTKAVLTLAAFALECGDFWLLSQYQPTDPLAKSLAILKRVPVLTKPAAIRNYQQAIVELNNLIKASLQVIETIFKLEKYSSSYDIKDVPALVPALNQIPLDVYWAIITIVACVTQIDCLITESEKRQDLSHFGQKINVLLSKLTKQDLLCKQQIEELEYYKLLVKLFKTPTEIMNALEVLIFRNDVPQNPIYDGATKTLVSIDVLKKKNVFLFISTLDITEEDINILRPIYEHKKRGDHYKIVWVPIVEEWTDSNKKRFETWKSKMPWFVVQHFGTVKGYRFIEKEWHFNKQPMVVTISPQSSILHHNAFHMIQAYGSNAFPCTWKTEEKLFEESSWIVTSVKDMNPNIMTWFKEEKYIFFYGGNDKDWLHQLTKCATALQQHPTLKKANISIELFCIQNQNEDLLTRFWSGIESLFVTKMHKTTNNVTQEVQKMLSYKNETGWAVLTKGSIVVLAGHGSSITKTVEEFQKNDFDVKKGFENSFKELHRKVEESTRRCSHLEIPNVAGKIPETIWCPICRQTMQVFISYKCCHNGTAAAPINGGHHDP